MGFIQILIACIFKDVSHKSFLVEMPFFPAFPINPIMP